MELGKTLYVKDRAGLAKIRRHLDEEFVIARDILSALQKDEVVWENFVRFPESKNKMYAMVK